MDFRWIDWNIAKVERLGVRPEECDEVVGSPPHPYPIRAPDERWLVKGPTRGRRLLQVVYLIDDDGTIFVIHARPLTAKEKHRFRRHSQ